MRRIAAVSSMAMTSSTTLTNTLLPSWVQQKTEDSFECSVGAEVERPFRKVLNSNDGTRDDARGASSCPSSVSSM